jgi:hypothetical protein
VPMTRDHQSASETKLVRLTLVLRPNDSLEL